MDYTTVTNPTYASADNSGIACMVLFNGMSAPLPFIAYANDPEPHGQQLYADLTALKFGQIAAYVAPAPTPVQLYEAAIAEGLAVNSASAPAVNSVYAMDAGAQSDIVSEATFITLYQEFTGGAQTFGWPDATGFRHTFPSTTVFMAFAKAAAQYVSGCKQAYAALASGGTATFPSNVAQIG